MAETDLIRTPDQRLRVFVSSTLKELAPERQAVHDAVTHLRLVPVMFELGARPHPPRDVYRAYLAQSQVFVAVYWESYGWVAPGQELSGLEEEYQLSADLPRLIYVKDRAPEREPRLTRMLASMTDDEGIAYKHFADAAELQGLVENDLAVLLSERFELTRPRASSEEDPLAGMLPAPPTPLVGRDQETGVLGDLVLREDVRLIVLTGPGGVGKSRLALAAGHRFGAQFEDGARYVDLAPVPSPDLVAAAIAAGLGLRPSGGRLISDLEDYLRSRRLLLVIDNFEQVTDAAALLAGLLAAAPGVTALVTSRTVLRIRGEHEVAVPGLPVPEPGAGPRPADLEQYAAVRLFVERAGAADPGFELTSRNGRAVGEICRRLDGLPLAIELAAAKVRIMAPRTLLARLDDRLKLLTGGPRDLPERQRTLRSTLDWSFDLLSAGHQALFAQLGVFAGGFDLQAAEAVGGSDAAAATGGPPAAGRQDDQADEGQGAAGGQVARGGRTGRGKADDVLSGLGALVDASLVRQADSAGEVRFSMLETVRAYALERLGHGSEWRTARDRHAAHYLAFAVSAEPRIRGPEQPAWLERLETEHGNLATALSWLLDQSQLQQAQVLGAMTWRFWWFHGHAEEFARFGERILAEGEHLPPEQLGMALSGTAFMLLAGGDQDRAQALFEQGLALSRKTGDKFGIAVTAGALGHLFTLQRDYARAGELLAESLALQQELGNDESVAVVYNYLGQIPLSQGDPDRAAQLFTQGADVSRHIPDRFPLLVSLFDLSLSSQDRGDLAGAETTLKEGLSLAVETGDRGCFSCYLRRLATVAREQDRPDRSVRLRAAAGALLQASGSSWLNAYVPPDPPDHDALTALRSRMGEAAFDEAWARGASMGYRSAFEYVLA